MQRKRLSVVARVPTLLARLSAGIGRAIGLRSSGVPNGSGRHTAPPQSGLTPQARQAIEQYWNEAYSGRTPTLPQGLFLSTTRSPEAPSAEQGGQSR